MQRVSRRYGWDTTSTVTAWANITTRCGKLYERNKSLEPLIRHLQAQNDVYCLCRQTLTQSLTTPLITAMLCVRLGVQCATRTNAFSLSVRSLATTTPSSSYEISSPGRFSSSWCTVGGSDHGGPCDLAGLCVGNSRQIRIPSGERSSAIRAAHLGLSDGGRAHRNCEYKISFEDANVEK
jgi:hypothetical protein